LLPKIIEKNTTKILEKCSNPIFVINLSIDGIGQKHDRIRGVRGNYEKVMETFSLLKRMKRTYSNLLIGMHTVISKHNILELPEIYDHIKDLNPDSYITEIAEHRSEMFNRNEDIPPNPDSFRMAIEDLSTKIRRDYLNSRDFFSRVTQALRLTYYQIAAETVEKKQQVIPCYAAYASCQITPHGDVWPCCVLGYDKPMGNLREVNYDFRKIWFSDKAKAVREFIHTKQCHCPLANANYTNILFNPSTMIQTIKNLWL
jgi:radical SAM protein with 4Fe4S-binding SPASM domain